MFTVDPHQRSFLTVDPRQRSFLTVDPRQRSFLKNINRTNKPKKFNNFRDLLPLCSLIMFANSNFKDKVSHAMHIGH